MKNICDKQYLKDLIKINQDKLNALIVEKDFNLQEKEVIKLSMQIDELLVKFNLCLAGS